MNPPAPQNPLAQSISDGRRGWLGAGLRLASAGLLAVGLSGCVAVVATGVVAGALSITDRRTTGAQADDQAIELRAMARLSESMPKSDRSTFNVVAFNRIALLTGRADNESQRTEAARLVQKIDNVRQVVNELELGGEGGIGNYSRDVVLTTRVKTALLGDQRVNANAIKVVTERQTVYLMGLVSAGEADRAGRVAASIPGVRRVVQVFEVLPDDRIRQIDSILSSGGQAPESAGPRVVPARRSGDNPNAN